ncbi:MAG: tetratricopeptide repeat protein [Acidobacteriia bacterium]|nr:tetratricopeptide repeat protein [Terriglobia bacterium]
MKFQHIQVRILVLFLGIVTSLSCVKAQTPGDAVGQSKRQQAMQLFEQGKRLEALPLLEELAQKNPKDEEVVVDLAASLVHHAATLTDQQAAGRERLRARDLLEKSGSRTPLAQNLLQLLREMPASGDIQFSENPAVEQAMRDGEAAFSQRDFDKAIQHYAAALKLEPKNYAAALFIANAYDKKDDFARAANLYESAIQLDPNIETAYRYYAHMLTKKGDMTKARTMLIRAAVAEPYNRMVWRDLRAWANINNTDIDFTYAGVYPVPEPAPRKDAQALDANLDLVHTLVFPDSGPKPKDVSDAWRAYHAVRAEWKQGGKFKEHFPGEAGYRHSLAEETEALTAAIRVLQRLRADIETAEQVSENQSLLLLLSLHQAGVLEPYVLFRLGDEGITKDYPAYRARHRDKLQEYMDKFVVPPAPANASKGAARSAVSPE